jgi:hypothetical protein
MTVIFCGSDDSPNRPAEVPFFYFSVAPAGDPTFTASQRPCGLKLSFNQNGLVLFQIFLNGRSAADGVGNSDGIGLGQFIMDQPLTDESHLKIQSRHPPDLTGFQWLQTNSARGLNFSHVAVCTGISA